MKLWNFAFGWSGGWGLSLFVLVLDLARHVSSSIYNREHRSLLSFPFLPFPLLTLRRMAEAKRKQADTNKEKDADINTEVVHDGAAIVRYAHHACTHTHKSKHIYSQYIYIHAHIYVHIHMHDYNMWSCKYECTHTKVHLYMHVLVYTWALKCMDLNVHVLMYSCIHTQHTYMCIYKYTMYSYIRVLMHTSICSHIYMYIHTLAATLSPSSWTLSLTMMITRKSKWIKLR